MSKCLLNLPAGVLGSVRLSIDRLSSEDSPEDVIACANDAVLSADTLEHSGVISSVQRAVIVVALVDHARDALNRISRS